MAREFDYRCKQAGQLASKMRFISAPWVGMLESGAWLTRARSANERAALLAAEVQKIPGLRMLAPTQSNAVFVEMPTDWARKLRAQGWRFYNFIAAGGARLMCAWDTTDDDVMHLVAALKQVAAPAKA